MSLSSSLKKVNKPAPTRPVWVGPCGEGPQGGVTQSLLSRYLTCKERFRVHTIEGLRPSERFNPTTDYGNMWHACEEALAKPECVGSDGTFLINENLRKCEEDLGRKFPLQRQEIAEWAGKCAAMFPRYVEHWAQHPDVTDRKPLLQEAAFDVPYRLPSGRVVRLRGKFDSVDLIGKGKNAGIWLQENKTKGTIDGTKINRQLSFDAQTMIYLVALGNIDEDTNWDRLPGGDAMLLRDKPLLGVRYNVVRRPLHKSVGSMLEKFEKDTKEGRIGEWFARWRVEVSQQDVAKFKRECLDPVLENLCDDYEWWEWCWTNQAGTLGKRIDPFSISVGLDSDTRHFHFPHHWPRHFRTPYMGYNPLSEGGFGDVDEYLATGSTVGLQRVDDLFPEL